jgi:hypothetical protein
MYRITKEKEKMRLILLASQVPKNSGQTGDIINWSARVADKQGPT